MQFYLLPNLDDNVYSSLNLTSCPSTGSLRKIACEAKKSDIVHPDEFGEIILLKDIFREEDDESTKLKGCVQYVAAYPLTVIMYTMYITMC